MFFLFYKKKFLNKNNFLGQIRKEFYSLFLILETIFLSQENFILCNIS